MATETTPKIQRYLKNVDVQFISLVDSAANRREFVYKSSADANPDFTTQFQIVKTDEEKRLVYGIVYAPDEADSHGDAMTADELQKAAHHFMEKARTQNVDTQHDFQADDGVIVESYILGKSDSKFPGEKEGAWAVVIKVTDDETWKAVKKGDLKGISLAGKAVAEKVEDDPVTKMEGMMSKFMKRLESIFSGKDERSEEQIEKDFKERVAMRQLRDAKWALNDEIDAILHDDEIDDKMAAINTAVDDFQEYISGLQVGGTTTKAKSDMSDEKKNTPESAETTEEPVEKKIEQPEGGDSKLSEKIDNLAKTVESLTSKVDELEKASPGRQSEEGAGGPEETEKSYNPKAPLNILGGIK